MRVSEVHDWRPHFDRAQVERVAGHTVPSQNPAPNHHIWNVQNWKNNQPGKVYAVHVWWYAEDRSDARVSCTCYAGQNGRPCKHAAWVIGEELLFVYWEPPTDEELNEYFKMIQAYEDRLS